MKPTIYGYLRVCGDTSEDVTTRARQELTDYAEGEGFTLAETFIERPDLPSAAFNGLIQAIGRTGTRDIVVPDLSHLCPLHQPGGARKAIIVQVAGARVWAIQP